MYSCYEGERLARLLKLIQGGIESAKHVDKKSLPEKFWFKQQFAIGVNEVTRALERMLPATEMRGSPQKPACSSIISTNHRRPPPVRIQVILIASDSNPKWLTKHLPSLASSRKIPVIFVRDKKGGSLRLGELVNLKTAIALGIKAKGNSINQIVEEMLCGGDVMNLETECQNLAEMSGALCQ
ncbi:uncharacterized protein LOC8265871 isoform X2 [Ricinus communis]|uniref:uncharacterized protein LOC8265871 isoform X2 n=1 Tax=Ricinus communis TaxID=3988 RepID=UPI00201B2B16|nr:uncharacterized protein LOC8265871 isoform X2 [Ricinus communis]